MPIPQRRAILGTCVVRWLMLGSCPRDTAPNEPPRIVCRGSGLPEPSLALDAYLGVHEYQASRRRRPLGPPAGARRRADLAELETLYEAGQLEQPLHRISAARHGEPTAAALASLAAPHGRHGRGP